MTGDPPKRALTVVPPPPDTTASPRTSTTLVVGFGPLRSRLFPRALAHARAGGELVELQGGRVEATFTLWSDPGAFAHLGALCRLIRPWRGTTAKANGHPVSAVVVRDMGFCAAHQLRRHGECQVRLWGPVPARCGPCPLFDPARLTPAVPSTDPTVVGWVVARRIASRRARRSRLRVVRDEERKTLPTTFTVVFGPSRSFDLQRALARARAGATRLTEGPDGSWRGEFVVDEDPGVRVALHATLRHLLMVRGTEVWIGGLPVSPGQAMGIASRMRPTYVVPPPRDLVSLLVDDLTEE